MMKKLFIFIFPLLFLTSCAFTHKQVIKTVNYDQLKTVFHKNDNVLYVVNFWATWCGPCVEELPGFMKVNKEYEDNPGYKMILVSLDNVNDFDKTLKPFIATNKITTDVYLLDDVMRMNMWIPDIDQNWGGAIPATVFYRNGKKLYFHEGQLDKDTLKKLINRYMTN